MGKPAARIGDMHTCPMVTGLVPHVGGPIIGPGVPTVLIGGMPAAVMGDIVTCTGPPDTIIMGSAGVFIGGKPAARLGDPTAHGGVIVVGCTTVLIGEVSPGGAGTVTFSPEGGAMQAAIKQSAQFATKISRIQALSQGAQTGANKVHAHNDQQCKVQYKVMDRDGNPAKNVKYEIRTSDGKVVKGKTNNEGMTQTLSGYTEGMCSISFID
jgi:uncharacterized Zn-binding protein involved in type VI secretion